MSYSIADSFIVYIEDDDELTIEFINYIANNKIIAFSSMGGPGPGIYVKAFPTSERDKVDKFFEEVSPR